MNLWKFMEGKKEIFFFVFENNSKFRGKFGEVKKCREKSTQHQLAAKFIQLNKEQDRIEALNEIEIMKALQHPRLLQLYDAFETKTNICLIMKL